MGMRGHVRLERSLQARPTSERESGHGRTVVGLCRRDDLPALRLPTIHVVSPGNLDRHLVRLGAAGDESNARETLRGEFGELVGKLFLWRVCQTLVVDVGELFRLGL